MPKNEKIKSILIIGSGPIIIGQACEFDYSGSQALRSLREDGIETVLINSNPATIMTDNVTADNIYLKPLTKKSIVEIQFFPRTWKFKDPYTTKESLEPVQSPGMDSLSLQLGTITQ